MRNDVKLGVSPRILYCVVDTSYELGGSFGDCRPALLKFQKYQMVKTQTGGQYFEQTNGRSGIPFPMRFAERLEFVTQIFGDSLKLTSRGVSRHHD